MSKCESNVFFDNYSVDKYTISWTYVILIFVLGKFSLDLELIGKLPENFLLADKILSTR